MVNSNEHRDPKEIEAIRHNIEIKLKDEIENLVNFLVFRGLADKADSSGLKEYLSNHNQEILEFGSNPVIFETLQEILYEASNLLTDEEKNKPVKEAEDMMMDHDLVDHDTYKMLQPDRVFIKEAIWVFKVRALLSKKILGPELTLDISSKNLARAIADICIRYDIAVTPQYEAFLNPGDTAAFQALKDLFDSGEYDQDSEKLFRKIGLKPEEYTEDKMNAEQAREDRIKQAVTSIMATYSNPMNLARKILDIKSKDEWPV